MQPGYVSSLENGLYFPGGLGRPIPLDPSPSDWVQPESGTSTATGPIAVVSSKSREWGLKIIRPLSATERKIWLATQSRPFNIAVTARVRGEFSARQVENALFELRKRHALLTARIVDREDGAYFTSDGVPPPSVHEVQDSSEDWSAAVQREMQQPFPCDTGPLVRCLVLRSAVWTDLAVICHRAVVDGLSAAYLIRDILGRLADPDIPVASLPVGQPVTSLIPKGIRQRFSFWFSLRAATGIFKARCYLRRKLGRSEQGVAQPAARTTMPGSGAPFLSLAWSISESQSQDLMERCRHERTTVYCALSSAFLKAFARINELGRSDVLRISSPMNLRKRLAGPVDETLGPYTAQIDTSTSCMPACDLWVLARQLGRKINRAMRDDRLFYRIIREEAKLRDYAELQTHDSFRVDKPAAHFSVADLGRLDVPIQYGSLKLDALYGPVVSGQEMERLLGVTTIGGRMFFTLTFHPMSLNPIVAERIKTRAMSYLASAVSG